MKFYFNINNFKAYATILLALIWGLPAFDFSRVAILHTPGLNVIEPYYMPCVIVALILLSLPFFINTLKVLDYVFVGVCASFYLMSYLFFPQNKDALDVYLDTFLLKVLPCYFLGATFKIREVKNLLYKVSLICLLACSFYSLIFIHNAGYSGNTSGESYNMSAAYDALPHVIMILWITMEHWNWQRLALSLLGIFLIITYGTRGPLICTILFIAIYLGFFKKYKHLLLSRLTLIASAAIIIFFLPTIMSGLLYLVSSVGMSGRILEKFAEGVFTESQGRDDLYDIAWYLLENGDGKAYGLQGFWTIAGVYPHNIFVEFLLSFGVLYGSILFMLLLFLLIIAFLKSKQHEETVFLIVLLFIGFIPLFLSSSFLAKPEFFLLLGYSVSIVRNNFKKTKIFKTNN